MLQTLKAFKRTGAVALLLFTLFSLPRDLQNSDEAAEPWRRALAMFDQNTALWIAVLGLCAWIVWTDFRPFVQQRRRRRPADLEIKKQIYLETSPVETDQGVRMNGLACNRAYVVVQNNRPDKRTLRKVRGKFYLYGAPRQLRSSNGDLETDLRHGEYAYFEVGRLLSHESVGFPLTQPMVFSTKTLETAQMNLDVGCPLFVAAPDDPNPHNIAYPKELPPQLKMLAWVTVTADDVAAANIGLRLDARKLPDINAAFVLEAPEEITK